MRLPGSNRVLPSALISTTTMAACTPTPRSAHSPVSYHQGSHQTPAGYNQPSTTRMAVPRHAWINHWLFVHPGGRQAIGCDPLEYFSDWEDSDEESYDATDEEEDADSQAGFVYGSGSEHQTDSEEDSEEDDV
ncbi:hypothetical protein GE09DRAFT_406493 [Coniochaeta sp. 2T2.1]|nr:hypothetical protein GE09DRAFT_406493 [Coniochaeta sp. 2T2.1]